MIDFHEHLRDNLKRCGRIALQSTCQLYYGSKPLGSGVLIVQGARHFLVSAAHVLDPEHLSEMMIPAGEEFIGLSGRAEVTLPPEWHTRSEDRVDIAVVELSEELAQELLPMYTFLDLKHVQIDHKQAQAHQYMLLGFPVEWTEKCANPDRAIAKPLLYRTGICTRPVFNVPEYPKNSKWLVDYPRIHTEVHTGKEVGAVDPTGLSGGGLWFIDVKEALKADPRPQLVGIITDHTTGIDQVIAATRTDVITEVLRQRFSIPIIESRTLHVNLG